MSASLSADGTRLTILWWLATRDPEHARSAAASIHPVDLARLCVQHWVLPTAIVSDETSWSDAHRAFRRDAVFAVETPDGALSIEELRAKVEAWMRFNG